MTDQVAVLRRRFCFGSARAAEPACGRGRTASRAPGAAPSSPAPSSVVGSQIPTSCGTPPRHPVVLIWCRFSIFSFLPPSRQTMWSFGPSAGSAPGGVISTETTARPSPARLPGDDGLARPTAEIGELAHVGPTIRVFLRSSCAVSSAACAARKLQVVSVRRPRRLLAAAQVRLGRSYRRSAIGSSASAACTERGERQLRP